MLIFVFALSHNCEVEVEHLFSHQSFPRPSLDSHNSPSGAYLNCADITYFISASVFVRS